MFLLLLFNFALMFCFDFHFKTGEAEIKSGGKESCQVFFLKFSFFFSFLVVFLPNSFRMQNGNNFSDFRVLNLLLFNELYQLIGLYLVAVFHPKQQKNNRKYERKFSELQ